MLTEKNVNKTKSVKFQRLLKFQIARLKVNFKNTLKNLFRFLGKIKLNKFVQPQETNSLKSKLINQP